MIISEREMFIQWDENKHPTHNHSFLQTLRAKEQMNVGVTFSEGIQGHVQNLK